MMHADMLVAMGNRTSHTTCRSAAGYARNNKCDHAHNMQLCMQLCNQQTSRPACVRPSNYACKYAVSKKVQSAYHMLNYACHNAGMHLVLRACDRTCSYPCRYACNDACYRHGTWAIVHCTMHVGVHLAMHAIRGVIMLPAYLSKHVFDSPRLMHRTSRCICLVLPTRPQMR